MATGLLTGAATNTPMLGAAQQTLLQTDPGAVDVSNQMATACAVGYPFGVIGVILCVVILSAIFRKNRGPKDTHNNQTFINEFSVSNPAVFGKTIRDIMKDAHIRIVVSRVWKYGGEGRGQVIIPSDGDTVLEEGEHAACADP